MSDCGSRNFTSRTARGSVTVRDKSALGHPSSAFRIADSARCPGWLNGVIYGMQIIPSALLPTTGRLAGQEKARVVRKGGRECHSFGWSAW